AETKRRRRQPRARRVRHTTYSCDGESPPRRRTAPPPLPGSPARQPGYRRALHGQPPRRGGGWRRDVQAGASWTAEKDNARANPQRISALPRLHPLSIGVSGRLLKTAGEPACERSAARKGAAPSQAPRVCEGPYLLRHMLPALRRARREVSERRAGTRAQRTSCVLASCAPSVRCSVLVSCPAAPLVLMVVCLR